MVELVKGSVLVNAIVKFGIAGVLVALGNVFAQTAISPPALPTRPAELASADFPKELKGWAYAWSRGNRMARAVTVVLSDTTNLNDIKGTLSFEDRDCPESSIAAPIENMKMVGGILNIDTPYSEVCIKNDGRADGIGTRWFLTARLANTASKWTATGNATLKSPTKTWQNYEVQLTSP